ILTKEESDKIVAAIASIESHSSAEVRVHIESTCNGDPLVRAIKVFSNLKMQNTADRNGVLVYVAVKSKKCAIVGDAGINKVVERDFWDTCTEKMVSCFKENNYCKGITTALVMASSKLSKHFPHALDDINELSDEISFGK
ncbi:MAG: TPM domain-containing protein, partial [Rikenellaceae bacterium]